jgi:hypothetical protein
MNTIWPLLLQVEMIANEGHYTKGNYPFSNFIVHLNFLVNKPPNNFI